METKTDQDQIIISNVSDGEKQRFPKQFLVTLLAGTIAGIAMIFSLFWGAEKLLGL